MYFGWFLFLLLDLDLQEPVEYGSDRAKKFFAVNEKWLSKLAAAKWLSHVKGSSSNVNIQYIVTGGSGSKVNIHYIGTVPEEVVQKLIFNTLVPVPEEVVQKLIFNTLVPVLEEAVQKLIFHTLVPRCHLCLNAVLESLVATPKFEA
jgi:hypothetical protein